MAGFSHTTIRYAAAGGFGGAAAWLFVLSVSARTGGGLFTEAVLGAITGLFIGGFIWSHEAAAGRQFLAAVKRAGYGAIAGAFGGCAGALLGSTAFTALGRYVTGLGGLRASAGIYLSVALGWAVLGAVAGLAGGLMIRSRERALYGLSGGVLGGLFGGLLFNLLSATSIWSALAGLSLLGLSIGAFISLVEEAFVSAKVKVIKGRHLGREFPLLKEESVIGRDDRSDVCLSGAEGVGIRHAVISRKNGTYVIEGEQGSAGVYVNQHLEKKSRLKDGDVIRVGSVLLMFSALRKAAGVAAVLLLAAFACAGPAAAEEARQAQITQFDLGAFPGVKAYVSVLDGAGRPVRGLGREDVSITENGAPVAITGMSMTGAAGSREPLSFALVMDKSDSMAGNKIELARSSVIRFLSLMEQGDRASLFAFSDEVKELSPLSGDAEQLVRDVRTIQPGGHTALSDAIQRGVDSVKGLAGRRAVVVLTDGIANRGAATIEQVIDHASRSNVSVYVIGLGGDVRTARLERIAHETGGSYFFTPTPEGLADIYEAISRRIHNEYAITFTTGKRAAYLRNVTLTLRPGLTAERAYFQPDSSLFGAGGKAPGWAFLVPLASFAGLLAVSFRSIERRYRTGHLSLVRGKGSKQEIDIGSAASIGRDERNTLGLFRDTGIEQRHAEVVRENGRYIIEDKGAGSGTFVNKKRVAGRQALADGDVIDVGNATIVFSEASTLSCGGCGGALTMNAKFCPKCGMKSRKE